MLLQQFTLTVKKKRNFKTNPRVKHQFQERPFMTIIPTNLNHSEKSLVSVYSCWKVTWLWTLNFLKWISVFWKSFINRVQYELNNHISVVLYQYLSLLECFFYADYSGESEKMYWILYPLKPERWLQSFLNLQNQRKTISSCQSITKINGTAPPFGLYWLKKCSRFVSDTNIIQ